MVLLHPYLVSVLVTTYPPSHMVATGSRTGPLSLSNPLRKGTRITSKDSHRHSEDTMRRVARSSSGRQLRAYRLDTPYRQSRQSTPRTNNRNGRTRHHDPRLTTMHIIMAPTSLKRLPSSSPASANQNRLGIRNNHHGIHQRVGTARPGHQQRTANGVLPSSSNSVLVNQLATDLLR